MGTRLATPPPRDTDVLALIDATPSRRADLVEQALADLRTYADTKSLALTQAMSATLNRAPYPSHDPDHRYGRLLWAELEERVQERFQSTLTGTTGMLERLLKAAPADGPVSDDKFCNGVHLITDHCRQEIDELWEKACCFQCRLRDTSRLFELHDA